MEDRLGRERHIELITQQFVRDVDLSRAREIVRRLGGAGVGTVLFVLDEERGPDWVRRVADAVL
jgi:hypothetical protein